MRNKRAFGFIVFFLIFSVELSYASHFRAGEILYKYLGPSTYQVTVNTYTEDNLANQDQDSVYLDWGDGFIESIARTNGILNTNGVPNGESVSGTIKKNIYISNQHTYSGGLPFGVISLTEFNRVDNVVNMANSVDVPFHLSDSINIDLQNLYGINSSPVFLNNPIDYANLLDTFYHNPNAFDADGDSLYFELVPSLQAFGVEVPQYSFPDEFPIGNNNNISINGNTGQLTWATPQMPGDYNIAIKVKEYRNGVLLGSLIRDMQILVGGENNDPPQINELNDLTVFAGDTIDFSFQVTDPNALDSIFLSATGSPFLLNPSRISFTTDTGNVVNANFVWFTNCSDIRKEPYQINFLASDNYSSVSGMNISLVDIESIRIRILPEVDEVLTIDNTEDEIILNWTDNNICTDSVGFLYYSIWRKDECDSLGNDNFYLIADGIENNTYADNTFLSESFQTYKVFANFGQKSNNIEYNVLRVAVSNGACIFSPKNFLGIEENNFNEVVIYPNPIQKTMTIKSELEIESIEMFNLLGERVSAVKNKDQMKVVGFEKGFYFVKIRLMNGSEVVKKVLIDRN